LGGRETLQGIFQDVTEQRQTERILRDLVEKNPLAIQILDKDGFTLKGNLAFLRIFGAIPPPGYSVFTDPQLKSLTKLAERAKKGEVVQFPDILYNPHASNPKAPDTPKWLRAVIFPLCDETGKPERFVIMHEDITARKLAEDRQRDEDARFKAIVSASKDIIYTADLKGKLTYLSPRVRDYGFEPEDLIGNGVAEFAHPEDKEFIQKAFANAIKTHSTLPILPYRIKRKDGTYFYAEQKSGIVFADGKPAYLTGVIRDVSEQKRTERRLKESEELMRMVFETAKDAIFIKDMNGMYVKANAACAELLGTTPEGLIGHTDSEYLPAEAAAKVFSTDCEVVRTGKTLSLNNFHPFPAGSRHVNIIKTPLRSVKGEIIGLLGIARDITDLKRTEAELALVRASQAVSDVARPMAHDFNNALAAINGYATLIDDELSETSPIKTEISQIIKAVKRAAELTSKFQDFARDPRINEKGGGDAR
jgi:PAS domain S-box-containing protein